MLLVNLATEIFWIKFCATLESGGKLQGRREASRAQMYIIFAYIYLKIAQDHQNKSYHLLKIHWSNFGV